jgi:RES domain-containing protein
VTPEITAIRRNGAHRLIPDRYADESVLARLAEDNRQLESLIELDGATDGRTLGEANLLPGVTVHELLFGVPFAPIVNAAFTHARPEGGRFNGPTRGAWYSAFEWKTAQAEIAFHKGQELLEIGWSEPETFVFHDYLADFHADFHDIRGNHRWAACLHPNSYFSSQRLARELLASGSAGIVYPSVRRHNGTCIACFRPALVTSVRKGRTVKLTFQDVHSSPAFG